MMRKGIRFLVHWLLLIKSNIFGTTTVGETAANILSKINDSNKVNPSSRGPNISTPTISKVAGTNVIKIAGLPIFFNYEYLKINLLLII